MKNYVIKTGEARIGEDSVSQPSLEEQEFEIQNIATQESIAEEIIIEESAVEEKEASIEKTEDNLVVDLRRPGLIRLMIGLTIASVASNLIIAGDPRFYGLLTVGFIWIVIGFKKFLFPERQ